MVREINCIAIRHNSETLQSKLDAMGFTKLKWTTNLESNQVLIASSYEHTIKGGRGYWNDKTPDKHFKGSYWNNGICEPKKASNLYDVGDDEELFLELAAKVIQDTYIYVDENGNQVNKPYKYI